MDRPGGGDVLPVHLLGRKAGCVADLSKNAAALGFLFRKADAEGCVALGLPDMGHIHTVAGHILLAEITEAVAAGGAQHSAACTHSGQCNDGGSGVAAAAPGIVKDPGDPVGFRETVDLNREVHDHILHTDHIKHFSHNRNLTPSWYTAAASGRCIPPARCEPLYIFQRD